MKIGTVRRAERIANEPQEGSVSSGTLRTEDLLRAFAGELRRICSVPPPIVYEAEVWLEGADAYNEAYPSELIYEACGLEIYFDLLDALSDLAPKGLRFGSHEGDGADFGWWRVEEETEQHDNWKTVSDENVRHVWKDPEMGTEFTVNPDFYEENGTPVSPETGTDCVYVRTEVIAAVRASRGDPTVS